MGQPDSDNAAYLCVTEVGGNLWLQGQRELSEATLSRSEYLSNVRDAVHGLAAGTNRYLTVTHSAMQAWLAAVHAYDKQLAHLSSQELAETLMAADILGDEELLQEVAAAQRDRMCAIKTGCYSPASAPSPAAEDTPVLFTTATPGPLRWFEQIVIRLSDDVTRLLLRHAVGAPKHIGDKEMDEWLQVLPNRLMVHVVRACSPCTDARGVLYASITGHEEALRMDSLLWVLSRDSELREVFVEIPPPPSWPFAVARQGFDSLTFGLCRLPALRVLHLRLRDEPMDTCRWQCLTGRLAEQLTSLTIESVMPDVKEGGVNVVLGTDDRSYRRSGSSEWEADGSVGCGAESDRATAQREFAENLTMLSSLEALTLVSLGALVPQAVAALRNSLSSLTTLRRLHVVNCAAQRGTAAIARTACRLPQLTHLHLGAAPGGPQHSTVASAQHTESVEAFAPLVKQARVQQSFHWLSADATELLETGGKEGAATTEPHRGTRSVGGAGWYLTDFDAVAESSDVDAGRALALACGGRRLRSLRLALFQCSVGYPWQGPELYGPRLPRANYRGIVQSLAEQPQLTSLFLAGETQPPEDCTGDALAAALAQMPALRVLGLRVAGVAGTGALQPEDADVPLLSWAPATVKLLAARTQHAVPLQSLSLEIVHAYGLKGRRCGEGRCTCSRACRAWCPPWDG
eukprot:jgi/Ulvmu1/4017/UM188_0007.1